jgi:hypothetical protein
MPLPGWIGREKSAIRVKNAGRDNIRIDTQGGKDFFGRIYIPEGDGCRTVHPNCLRQAGDIRDHVPPIGDIFFCHKKGSYKRY